MARQLTGGWLKTYMQYTEQLESPTAFHFFVGLSVLSAAVRRHIWLEQGFLQIHPNTFIFLIAQSARCRKSTACKVGLNILENVPNIPIFGGKSSTEGFIQWIHSITPHQVGSRIITDQSPFVMSDELAVFFSTAQYAREIIDVLTQLYDGHTSWPYQTVKHGTIELKNISPVILAATTPRGLSQCMSVNTIEFGFAGRVLFVCRKKPRKKMAWPKHTDRLRALRAHLVEDLEHIANLQGEMRVSPDALDYFEQWYNADNMSDTSPLMDGYYNRKHMHMLKIAMLLSINESDKLLLEKRHLEGATKALASIERQMPDAFQFFGTTEAANNQEIIRLLRGNNGRMYRKDLAGQMRAKVRSLDEFDNLVRMLVETDMISIRRADQQVVYCLNGAGLHEDEAEGKTDEGLVR